MRKSKPGILSLLLLLVFLCFPVPVLADDLSVSVQVETDTSRPVFQGEMIAYRAVIRPSGWDCWLRAVPDIHVTGLSGFTPECLVPGDGWIRRGGAFYLTKPAEAGTDYTAVTAFRIPDNNSDVAPGSEISIAITAEAVPYMAFVPDFDSEDPWGDAIPHAVSSGSSGGGGIIRQPATGVHVYRDPNIKYALATYGTWVQKNSLLGIWGFRDINGAFVKDGWIYTYNPYSRTGNKADFFHFDASGNMSVGWVEGGDGVWYYTKEVSDGELGMLLHGWIKGLPDGNTYYADTETGQIATGLTMIDKKRYYFASSGDNTSTNRLFRMVENTGFGRWVTEKTGLRTLGSMYQNEQSPAGFAGKDGAIG